MLTIKNTQRRMLSFNLEHEELRSAPPPYGYASHRAGTVDADPTTGARAPRVVQKSLPATITFLAEETRYDLPNVLKGCPEIAAALRDGRLRLLKETPESAAQEAAPAAPAGDDPPA